MRSSLNSGAGSSIGIVLYTRGFVSGSRTSVVPHEGSSAIARITALRRDAPSAPTTKGTESSVVRIFPEDEEEEEEEREFSLPSVPSADSTSGSSSSHDPSSSHAAPGPIALGSRTSVAPPRGSHSTDAHAVSCATETESEYFSSISSNSAATRRSR